jgi:hypothetical protein
LVTIATLLLPVPLLLPIWRQQRAVVEQAAPMTIG